MSIKRRHLLYSLLIIKFFLKFFTEILIETFSSFPLKIEMSSRLNLPRTRFDKLIPRVLLKSGKNSTHYQKFL